MGYAQEAERLISVRHRRVKAMQKAGRISTQQLNSILRPSEADKGALLLLLSCLMTDNRRNLHLT